MHKIIPIESLLYSYKVSRIIKELVSKHDIEIVESPDWLYEGLCYSMSKTIPIVMKLHGHNSIFKYYINSNHVYTPISVRIGALLEKQLALRADKVTSVSKYYASNISNLWGISEKRIEIIPNGVLLSNEIELVEKTEKTILFIGRIGKSKGVDLLFDVIPHIWQKIPEVKLVLIGDYENNDERERIEQERKELLRDNRILILASIEYNKLSEYYSSSDICIFPSKFENLGTVALEAMAHGKPVIVTDVGGFKEIISNGVNGYVIKPGDMQGLVNIIIHLLKDLKLRSEIGRNAFKSIEAGYSIEEIASKTVKTYKDIIIDYYNKKGLQNHEG